MLGEVPGISVQLAGVNGVAAACGSSTPGWPPASVRSV